jgi:PadR family transcriptional regulator, regulatory protein PadR
MFMRVNVGCAHQVRPPPGRSLSLAANSPSWVNLMAHPVEGCADRLDIGSFVYNVDNMSDGLGLFEQAVLLALVQPQTTLGQEAYGRSVLKEVQLRLQRPVTAGAVYATLDRLEEKGLVSSRLGPGTAVRGGRPKRYYAIEGAGIRALNHSKAIVDRLWAGIPRPLNGAV